MYYTILLCCGPYLLYNFYTCLNKHSFKKYFNLFDKSTITFE